MPSLDDIAQYQTSLSPDAVLWLHGLVADWQIIADLSFADLILWLPDAEEQGFWAGAQVRPATGPTTLVEDIVGSFIPAGRIPSVAKALETGQVAPAGDDDDERIDAVPVQSKGETIAVVERRTRVSPGRAHSALEAAYRDTADDFVTMITQGQFPPSGERTDLADSLRVGDGFLRLNASGLVDYASPNAMSAFSRVGHSGELLGTMLGDVVAQMSGKFRTGDAGPVRIATLASAQEVEVEAPGGIVVMRAIPLVLDGRRTGTAVLLREVTDLRRREQQLMSREATIREIHHRVKNNLQTVAALLRLQSRRMDVPEAREALDEAMRRIGSIALVHEMLSYGDDEAVDFDSIADRLLAMVPEVAAADVGVTTKRSGTFGTIDASVATPLSMVITELIQNAVQHAFDEHGGSVNLAVNRIRHRLRMRISDNGRGLPEDFDPAASLGLSIVSTLVESELGGTLSYASGDAGTTVEISLELP